MIKKAYRNLVILFITCYNNSSHLKTFFKNVLQFLVKTLGKACEIIFVGESVAFSLKSSFHSDFQVNSIN